MKTIYFPGLRLWVLPGLIAGMLFLGIALVSGTLATGTWAMPDAIAHVLGMPTPANYGFALAPVMVGIAVHLGFSIGLGSLFTAITVWWRLQGWRLVVAGIIFIGCETPIALWVVMHPLLPSATFHYYLAAIPLWGSILGHFSYVLSLVLLLALRSPISSKQHLQLAS